MLAAMSKPIRRSSSVRKPGSQSTTPDLPLQISLVKSAVITYDVASTHTGSGNTAFDIWLTDTANPDTWGVPPITHEIMIWLEAYGSLAPGGNWVETVPIGGADYSIYLARIGGTAGPISPSTGRRTRWEPARWTWLISWRTSWRTGWPPGREIPGVDRDRQRGGHRQRRNHTQSV